MVRVWRGSAAKWGEDLVLFFERLSRPAGETLISLQMPKTLVGIHNVRVSRAADSLDTGEEGETTAHRLSIVHEMCLKLMPRGRESRTRLRS